jgi:hypothetical protein
MPNSPRRKRTFTNNAALPLGLASWRLDASAADEPASDHMSDQHELKMTAMTK